MKYKAGDMFPTTVMEAVIGEAISLPDPNCLVHLQFRRFVDCPICNTHIAEFRKRAREIESAGIKEVIMFHSSPKSIRSYQKDVPFLMVGYPKKVFYKDFGVETSLGFASPNTLMKKGFTVGRFLWCGRGAAQRRASRASAGALIPLEDHRDFFS